MLHWPEEQRPLILLQLSFGGQRHESSQFTPKKPLEHAEMRRKSNEMQRTVLVFLMRNKRTRLAEGRVGPASIADEVDAVAFVLVTRFLVKAVTLAIATHVEEASRTVVRVS